MTKSAVLERIPAIVLPLAAVEVGLLSTVVATPSGKVYAAQHASQVCVSQGISVLLVEKRRPAGGGGGAASVERAARASEGAAPVNQTLPGWSARSPGSVSAAVEENQAQGD